MIAATECDLKGGEISSDGAHVTLDNVTVNRGTRPLVSKLRLDIPRGKFVAIVGPSGTGKTSLLFSLAGMIDPEQGSIKYRCNAGCEHNPDTFRQKIGFIFQDLRLVPNSTMLKNVLCGRLSSLPWWRTLWGFPNADHCRAIDLLKGLGLGGYTHKCAHEVSGGEQQRAAIARAILQDPEVYLADEPVAHLDQANAERVLELFRAEAHERQKTIFCALHDLDLVERYADWVLQLDPRNPEGWNLREIKR